MAEGPGAECSGASAPPQEDVASGAVLEYIFAGQGPLEADGE